MRIIESSPLRYVLSLPTASTTGAPTPVLCFLHGYDEAAPLDIRRALTRHGPLRAGSWPGATEQFIVVAPQLPRAGDLWHRYALAVAELVVDVQRTHVGDPARTYLTGFSFGGNGVLDLATRQPELWAALWPVDPTRPPRDAIAAPVLLSVGELARHRLAAFVGALGLHRVDTRVGEVTRDRVYLDEGEDHVGSATRAYADARIYRWLLARLAGR